MPSAKPPRRQFESLRTYKDKVHSIKQHLDLVTITKINSFTLSIEGRKRVKLVVNLELTADGRKRIEQEIEN
jgi:hypothetical protein